MGQGWEEIVNIFLTEGKNKVSSHPTQDPGQATVPKAQVNESVVKQLAPSVSKFWISSAPSTDWGPTSALQKPSFPTFLTLSLSLSNEAQV